MPRSVVLEALANMHTIQRLYAGDKLDALVSVFVGPRRTVHYLVFDVPWQRTGRNGAPTAGCPTS